MEDNSTWRNVIHLKYGSEEGGWFPIIPKGNYGVGLWKEISKEIVQIKRFCSIVLGDGCKTRFWEDVWCGEATLCTSFPSSPCMMWPILKELGWRISKRFQGRRVDEISCSKDTLMIGRWKWFKTS